LENDVLPPNDVRHEPTQRIDLATHARPGMGGTTDRGIPLDLIAALDPEALIVDLDGTLLAGGELLPGARVLLGDFGARIVVATNNSTDSPGQIARRLARHGVHVAADHIVTAGFALIDRLVDGPPSGIHPVLPPALLRYGRHRGLCFVDAAEAEIVALARHVVRLPRPRSRRQRTRPRGAAVRLQPRPQPPGRPGDLGP
jgi:hypothetical protein